MMPWIYAHLIGDFILQTDRMAADKKKPGFEGHLACTVHIMTYIIPFFFCSLDWWQLGLIGIQHYLQDRTNFVVWLMKAKGSGDFAKPPTAPWSIIATDNILHILFIALVVALPGWWR